MKNIEMDVKYSNYFAIDAVQFSYKRSRSM